MTSKSKNIGLIIKQQRVMSGLTLQQLGEMSGVSQSHLARIEMGERFLSARILGRIAKPLGFEEAEIFTLASYLSPKPSVAESERDVGHLDPYVARVLSQEPVEVQRTVLGILHILKSLARLRGCSVEFAEYAHTKYPQLNEDTVTIIEDILNRESAKVME